MIYDLIQLPMRNVQGDLSTICPLFTRMLGMDDVDWYGRTINLTSAQKRLFKYKSIEPISNSVFERLFLTTEPIDFKKKWITADIEIFPITFKVYKKPFNPYCSIYRYLNGSLNALAAIDGFCHMQTINNKLMKMMWPYDPGCNISKRTYDLIPQIAYGTDNQNISRLHNVRDFMDESGDYISELPTSMESLFPEFPKDCTENLYLNNMIVSDLKPVVSNQCFTGIFRGTMLNVEAPFEINKTTIFTEDNEFYRWSLHELIQDIEMSVFTDMHIVLQYETANKVTAKQEMFSRYIGLTPNKLPGEDQFVQSIVEHLRKWSNMTTGCLPKQVELWKNWAEEIFITIKSDKGEQHYYFDLALYSLANMSFVDVIA